MAINKVDIYGPEWIELVFKDRNKSYGAYDLRKHYTRTVLKALGITFGSIAALVYLATLLLKPAPVAANPLPHEVTTVVHEIIITSPTFTHTAHHHHHIKNGYAYSPAPANITPQSIAPAAPVPNTNPEPPAAINNAPASTIETSNEVYTAAYADVKPMPQGGAQGWMSFLQKNLVYPAEARHNGISGKTWLSFVVEKDGSITNITIDTSAGHGFDEEAVRVLALSPAWQPGIKNGEPIRIRYHLPVNFQMVK